jgi:hypothetical protein
MGHECPRLCLEQSILFMAASDAADFRTGYVQLVAVETGEFG